MAAWLEKAAANGEPRIDAHNAALRPPAGRGLLDELRAHHDLITLNPHSIFRRHFLRYLSATANL